MALSSRAGGSGESVKVIDVSDMGSSEGRTGDAPPPEPANLRLLRRLVTVLTVVMIAGIVAVAAAFVIRLRPVAVAVPETLALPDGATAHAVTQMPDGWIVTTRDGRAFVFAPEGRLRGEMVMR